MQQTPPTSPRSGAGAASVAQAPLLLGRYRVLATNTDGGFGTVSVCWDTRLQRRVAIKRMPLYAVEAYAAQGGPGYGGAGADGARRSMGAAAFDDVGTPAQASTIDEALKEARTSSMLAHPNIVTMYDFEEDGYYSYLVMEYVDGLSLAQLLSRVEGGVLTFDECAHVADSIAAALAYAHENGVLHLDIKPANILVDRSGTVKLGDFGMATLASAAGYEGARGGTVGYMPPEQIEGAMVDERTDIFSLAVVVWQSLVGSCPFAASTPEQSLSLIRRGPSPTLSRIEPELAGMVEETLLRAMDADPRARMASVEQFAHDLVRALGDEQEGAESLRYLLNQADDVGDPTPEEDWGRANLPLLVRMPWIGDLCTRALSAATAGWAAAQTIPHILPDAQNALLFGTAGMCMACAAWPPLNGALGILALAAAIAAQMSRESVALAATVGIAGLAWWLAVGRRSHLAGTAVLLPSALGSPLAGVGLSGFSLRPVGAFATGTASWVACALFRRGIDTAFAPSALVDALVALAGDPLSWMLAGGCGLAAWLCALVSGRGTVTAAVVGQVLAAVLLAFVYVAYAHMENASIAQALDRPALAVAVTLGVTLCIAVALAGAGVHRQEDDKA